MSTEVDITLGLNLEIGSVPVSLSAELATSAAQTVYTFNGCMQTATIDIGSFISMVGSDFGVDVQLPPELNLEAIIDYVAGQVIYTSPTTGAATTELGVSAKFDLVYKNGTDTQDFTFTFYADTIISSPAPATGNPYVVGGSVDTDLKFANLPLVGSIPGFNEYTLKHLGFSYTNTDPQANGKPVNFNIPKVDTSANPLFTRTNAPDARDKSSYAISNQGGQTTFSLAQKGFSFTAGLMKEGSTQPENNFALPMSLPSATPANTPASYYQSGAKVNTSPPSSPIHWINVNKTFGPVSFQKIGLNYSGGEATFGLSAGLAMGGFSLDVQGLAITFPLPLPGMPAGDQLSFSIDGLGMEFQEPGLTIGGAFLKAQAGGFTNYFGEVIVQVGPFGFKAIGGYSPAQNNAPAAFFLYANLDVPLGGLPFLYVTGLAFGFGVNYGLVLPTMETLPTYLLLPNNAPPQGSAQDALTGVITQLVNGSVIINEPGEYWVAAGIQFTSFDMVTAFAMLTFSFGVEMQVALIGSCSIVLPQGDPYPLASIQVNLVASITPSTGQMGIMGALTPASYVFGSFIKLSGGFAFCLWFSGEHRGDFVVTLGGYFPSYTKPAWYPAVPRVQVTANLGPLQFAGSAYLALTPSMFMAGLQLAATFTAGPIKAWFSAGADFMISWAPFMYEADAYVNIGCSINLGLFTLNIHVGADVQIWGTPFGGVAHVDLDVVSFTIGFGSDAVAPAPVTWQNIELNFLPPPTSSTPPQQQQKMMMFAAAPEAAAGDTTTTANVSASVATGLTATNVVSEDGENWDWIVDPSNFVIITSSTVPSNYANWTIAAGTTTALSNDPTQYNLPDVDVSTEPYLQLAAGTVKYSPTQVWNPTLNVKPMKLANVKSHHTITLLKRTDSDSKGQFSDYLTAVSIEPVLGSSNTALWGDPTAAKDANTPALLPATLLGFQIIPLPRNPDTVNNVPLIDLLFTAGEQTDFSYTSAQPDDQFTVTSSFDKSTEDLSITITGGVSQQLTNSDYILSSLIDSQVAGRRNPILDDIAANGFHTYTAAQVTLTIMGTTEALTDWPVVEILGDLTAA
ncbi:DUF6603 domain-containing protein [Mucilaginibacter xinganensis]|uniref:DUF6603 domain-containing protein n=1 Tax=Mucilaginibacter xinganensis TaxID=1234841 RepID=A0A223NUH8_9SPHI|nr:DUF6603 domain-containing protein [Mucilaginibacter xinganensis]ASU33545.1 hypothetical protein MuYL_1649 [Mucilaginibacter xinganensis]